jgi:hypothetical protein
MAESRRRRSPIPPKLGEKKLKDLTAGEMREVINSLVPRDEMHAGIQFLNLLLDKKGIPGVIAFVEKAKKILDEEGKLLDYDFDASEKELLKKAWPDLMARRNALGIIGAAVSGAIFAGVAGIDSAVTAKKIMNPPPAPPPQAQGVLEQAQELAHRYAYPVAEIMIGAVLMNEGVENWRKEKLEGVANAVADLAEAAKKQQQQKESPAP